MQVPRLLATVAGALDGRRDAAAVAARVSAELGRTVTAGDVTFLVEERLAPAGLVEDRAGVAPAPRDTSVLGLGVRTRVLPARLVDLTTRPLVPLFRPPVVVAVLAGLAAFDAWLFGVRGLGGTTQTLAAAPAVLLAVAALTIASGAFHELGHAAACRYGGARPGVIGVGLYLVWPAFFNNLDDAYRLDRRGRLRTDLGGVYFNGVFVLALGLAYALTGAELLLVAAVVQHLLAAHQLLPFLRLDGYHLVSDLAGVPDLAARWRPIVAGLLVGRRARAAVADLRPGPRRLVLAWVALTVPAAAGLLVVLALGLPEAVAFAGRAVQDHALAAARARAAGQATVAAAHVLHLAVAALPVAGLGLLAGRLAWRGGRRMTQRSSSRRGAS